MKPITFNLPRFIPLLAERIKTLNPFTRMFLVQWIITLDSVPDLELIAYLPDFLDGLFQYLSDPNIDVRVASLNVLAEFLKEIHDVVEVQREKGVLNIRGKKVDGLGVSFDVVSHVSSSSSTIPIPGSDAQNESSSSSSSSIPSSSSSSSTHELSLHPPPPKTLSSASLATADSQTGPSSTNNSPLSDNGSLTRAPSTLSMTGSSHQQNPNASNSNSSNTNTTHQTPHLFPKNSSSTNTNTGTAAPLSKPRTTITTDDGIPYTPGQDVVLDIGRIVDILLPHLQSTDEETQATALRWVYDLIGLVRNVMLPFTPSLLNSVLPCLSHPVGVIAGLATESNGGLFALVVEWTPDVSSLAASVSGIGVGYVEGGSGEGAGSVQVVDPFDVQLAAKTLTMQFQDGNENTRIAGMDWLLMLHKKFPKKVKFIGFFLL
jgi:vacuole morphology and inheritance protein 14